MKHRLAQKGILAATIAATLGTAYAETTLEEVTVTARKRAENVQEVPIAVTAFTAQDIQDAGIERDAGGHRQRRRHAGQHPRHRVHP